MRIPQDPAESDKLLRGQTEKLKEEMPAETGDAEKHRPEIVRLSKLAEQAVQEGALDAAKKFHASRLKARVGELSSVVDKAEES